MVDDLALSGSEGLLADEDPVDGRAPLDARGGVDHVTGDHCLALTRRSVERDESLAGVDSDPNVEIAAGLVVVQSRDRILHHKRGAHRALRVVFVRDGAPKTPTTASPMNFSTVPPWLESIARMLVKQAGMTARTSSGSGGSAIAVEPRGRRTRP